MTKEEHSKQTENNEEENAGLKEQPKVKDTMESVETLILDNPSNKYDTILLVRRWAYELKSKDQDYLSIQELIPRAIKDILSVRVNHKTVRDLPVLKLPSKKQKEPSIGILQNIGKSSDHSADKSGSEKKKSSSKKDS